MKEQVNLNELNALVYQAVKNNGDVSEYINKMNFEEITAQMWHLSTENPDYAKAMLGFIDPERFTESIKELFWATSALEAALPHAKQLNDKEKTTLYHNYITLLIIYVSNIYNPALLNEDDIRVLPQSHRFGYFMYEAQKCLGDNDSSGYVKNLKTALTMDKSKSDIISTLINQL
ncbi:MAG: hypothetical protein FWD34_08270 [Oscillospiraceae bacterium]|nr:hypothetical protein [Oscillospiraceae bacterium]